MKDEAIKQAAGLLMEARQERRRLNALPEACRPETDAEGYLIQDALVRALGWRTRAWKVACTSPSAQRALKTDSPFSAQLALPALHPSPAEILADKFFMRMVEGEIAFRLGADLPAREAPYGPDEVADAIASVVPAIEIADSRYEDWLSVGKPSLIADQGVAGALVVGQDHEDWQALDLAGMVVRMKVDGRVVGEGRGRYTLGGPFIALQWLVNQRSARGQGLAKGHLVTTGTCTGNFLADAGTVARAEFEGLDAVEVRFTD